MPKAAPALTSFNAGEWSSRMEGRVDLAKYPNACRELENFLPMVQGPLIKRSGTRFVKEVRDSTKNARLIPFEFGTEQAYVLEFSDFYIRVYKDSGGVLETTVVINTVGALSPIPINTTGAHGYATGNQVFITGTTPTVRRELFVHGVKPPLAAYKHTIKDALKAAHRDKTAA